MADRIRVVIVNGSAVMRQLLSRTLAAAGGIEVIATASDPLFALEKMRTRWPDVLISDIDMPRLDGVRFIKQIMAQRPTPVIVCSAQAASGTSAKALAAGAVTVIAADRAGPLKSFVEGAAVDIVQAVRRAAEKPGRPPARNAVVPRRSADAVVDADLPAAPRPGGEHVIAIGTSTGGTNALEAILTHLPTSSLGIVIVQHMPAVFTAMFAERLDTVAQIEVREAQNGDQVFCGRALIAPGGKHMMLRRSGAQYRVEVVDGPLVNRHRPSVDVLFRSVAKSAGANALGIIMTGMGDDGARGLKEMHDAGARTIAQDEASCVVFGMPNEAIKLGAVDLTLPLDGIAPAIVNYSRGSQ